jgi:hypothetical protein
MTIGGDLGLPPWLTLLVVAMMLLYGMFLAGRACARAGMNPALALLLLIPVVQIVAVWVFAYMRWPSYENAREKQDPRA